MPELPEVETICRFLREGKDGPSLIGQTILEAEVLWARSVAQPESSVFSSRINRQSFREIRRRAKYLVLTLDKDHLLVHLRMSGDLRVEPETQPNGQAKPLEAHDRVVFHLTNGWRLVFNDARKFGRMWLVNDQETVLGGLGPEPLDPAMTAADFYHRLHQHKRQLKPLLLDQSFLSGLGNIYTDEALHLARLHPGLLSHRLDPGQAERLIEAIRNVLWEGIRRNGASIDWVYRGGDYQNTFRVYRRTGLPCPACGTAIVRQMFGQRSTHICPVCQPLLNG